MKGKKMRTDFPFEHPLDEWVIVGKELLERDPDATLWDLLCVMYKYKTGCDVPEMPNEYDVVNKHMLGRCSSTIAKELETDIGSVANILTSMGYTPFRADLPCSVHTISLTLTVGGSSVSGAAKLYGMTEHMVNRTVDEYNIWLAHYLDTTCSWRDRGTE